MKFRYIRRGLLYYPQYLGKDEKWYFFKEENLSIDCALIMGIRGFSFYLGKNLNSIHKLFKTLDSEKEKVLFFENEFTTFTFLGAATYWFKTQKIEYNIDINEQETIN